MDSDFLRLSRRVGKLETAGGGAATAGDGVWPTGAVMLWPAAAAPHGWLLCDGGAVSRSAFAALCAVIGTVYGSGDGSVTFNLPDLKGRFAVGCDSTEPFNTPGGKGGENTHVLTTAEMPAHGHTQSAHSHSIAHDHAAVNTGNMSANHTHSISFNTGAETGHTHRACAGTYNVGSGSGSTYKYFTNNGSTGAQTSGSSSGHTHLVSGTTGTSSANHTHSVDLPAYSGNSGSATAVNQSEGGGASHNNLPPYLVLNYIIKT